MSECDLYSTFIQKYTYLHTYLIQGIRGILKKKKEKENNALKKKLKSWTLFKLTS